MSLYETLFWTAKKESPKLKGITLAGSIAIQYSTSFEVFFRFYARNPFVGAVVSKIREDMYRHGYVVKKYNRELKDDYFSSLLGTRYTPKKFFERLIRDFEITGNCYVYLARKWLRAESIQPLDPRYVKPITNPQGVVMGYVQNLDGLRFFTPDEVLHFKEEDDLDDETIGKSKMTSLFIDLETEKEARESNLAFFKNNQTPSSLVLMKDGFELDENDKGSVEAMANLKAMFQSGEYTGGKNHFRTSFIQWVEEIVKVQDKIDDMQFIELRRFTREAVCSVYGVTLDIIGITENSNRSVWETQSSVYYDFIEGKEKTFDTFLTKIVQSAYNDTSLSVSALQDSTRQLLKRAELAGSLYKDKQVITLNEARTIIQYDPIPEGDRVFKEPEKEKTDGETEGDKEDTKEDTTEG